MFRFLLRRLMVAVPTLFLVVTAAFFMMRAAPGNPFDSDRKLPPEVERSIMAKYGMDRPLGEQYVAYVGNVLQGDLGPSLKYKDKSVAELISEGLPTSAVIGLSALTLACLVGIGLGIIAALRQNQMIDNVTMAIAVLGVCIPTFVTAPLLVLVFAAKLGWLPTAGLNGIRSLILPVAVLALPQIAIISRLTRAGMIEVLRSNYIRTARAKGLSEVRIVLRHGLRAAILPLVSYLGPACAGLLTGSLVIEKIFSLPGLGKSFVIGALQRDYTVVMGVVIVYAGLILLLNLLADIAYAMLDPRVRLS
ncbi:MAG: oligopeptide transporter permease OppB [Pseudomonadota bacterium]|jgi:oligopeptide transport system permease protein